MIKQTEPPSFVRNSRYNYEMQSVAHHLQIEANKLVQDSTEDADLYARSAFNRYYYATFLCVRKALVGIDSKYDGALNHKGIPDILRGNIQRRIKNIQKKAGKLSDGSLVQDCQRASSQNLSFADLLEKAYAIRVVADYTPETPVRFNSERFTLSGVPVTEAHEWTSKASLWSTIVINVFRQENA